MKPCVVVISYSISTALGVIRSLGSAGYPVDYFCITTRVGESKTVSLSKYVNSTTEFYGRKDDEIVAKLCEKYKAKQGKCVLFPADDYCASLIDRYRDSLSALFDMPYIVGKGQGAVSDLMDKTVQSSIAAKCGFAVAKEWNIPLCNDEIDIPEDIVYPCFVKPLASVNGRKSEMRSCSDAEELISYLHALQNREPDRAVLVQEYLNIDQEYSMSGVCADREVILPAIVKKYQIAQFRKGATLMGELVPIDEISPVKEALYCFLKEIRYVGMFDLEVMRVGKQLYFGELNLRSGGPHYSYFASGINLPALAVQAITGEPFDEIPAIQFHRVFLNDQDGWEDYLKKFITKQELKDLYNRADILLLDRKDDPAPGKFFLKNARKKELKLRIKKILKR